MELSLETYGFPSGYFVIKNIATNRLLDVQSNGVEDGTGLILWPENESSLVEDMRRPEANNQVFFIDIYGALCSRSSGHAIDIENDRLVLRHRRPITHPCPNAFSHPLPRFSYDPETQHINITFEVDPTYPNSGNRATAIGNWKDKGYFVTALPLRKSRTMMDNASEMFSNAITSPLSLFGSGGHSGPPKGARPNDIFETGEFDLMENEILETDRSEEGEVDDSPERYRPVRMVGLTKEDECIIGDKARKRAQWVVVPIKPVRNRRIVSGGSTKSK
ncbi:hypothetical protein BDY19DRAFT_880903 [Irpex rosettiformis]|uniref:Uncharacterized protein n=1 Tax=Irpex rosettiformis TaxID=378272 RepID=A0ACB8UIZ9_9APHY|nr:hypothetical protein BDY19DRAFT_880903 [Irpex rosettiformis]